jgi:hypothetical protein
MKKELSILIPAKVLETFQTIFGVHVREVTNPDQEFNDDDLIGKTVLSQDGQEIVMRFAFPRSTLKPLLLKIYEPILASHESTVEDAVCEIVNIVCTSIKSNLNDKGYALEMTLPVIDMNFRNPDVEPFLNISFTLDPSGFLIDVEMKETVV